MISKNKISNILSKPYDRILFGKDILKPIFSGFLTSFLMNSESGTAVELTLEDSNSQPTKCTPTYWDGSARVILDTPTGRQIGLMDREDDKILSKILNKIITKRIKTSLYGARNADECSPTIIWATEEKQ